jgi:site-specific recombinase XerD
MLDAICLRIYDNSERPNNGRFRRRASALRISPQTRHDLIANGLAEDDGTWLVLTEAGRNMAAALRNNRPSRARRRTGYRRDSRRHRIARAKVTAAKKWEPSEAEIALALESDEPLTLQVACGVYLRDLRARNLSQSTLDAHRSLFLSWLTYAKKIGLLRLSDWDQARMRAWREAWTHQPSTQSTRLQQLRAFFTFAVKANWIDSSAVEHLKPPKVSSRPIMPLTQAEMESLLAAADDLPSERALIMLMRFSGLSIRDAVTLRRDAVNGNNLTLRRAKSDELVMAYIPNQVLEALEKIAEPNSHHYFSNYGATATASAKHWRSRLQFVGRKAGIRDFRPHRLRHTFSVEALIAQVDIQDLSSLLGHGSVATTERHYAQWNSARRDRLVRIMRDVYQRDPLLRFLDARAATKNNAGAVDAAPADKPGTKP